MRIGVAPVVGRSLAGYRDILARKKAERLGEHMSRSFGDLIANRWPTGRLEVFFANGAHEPDVSRMDPILIRHAIDNVPQFAQALRWAGWI